MSRPHRNVREANKAKSHAKSLLVASNMAIRPVKAPLIQLIDGHGRQKTISLGFRTSPNMKQSHHVRIHFSPLGGNSNPDKSLTSKQVQVKYRHQPLTCGAK